MGKRCVVMFCSNSCHTGQSVHVFPKNPVLRRQWIRFVEVKRANFKLTENSVICGAHFEKECMSNALKIAMGYSVRPLLSPDAVPTIQPAPTEEQMAKARRACRSKRPRDSQATTSTIQTKVPRKSRAVEKRETDRVSTRFLFICNSAKEKKVPILMCWQTLWSMGNNNNNKNAVLFQYFLLKTRQNI
uniref:THAP domain-containing protein 1 n=1 Tax=Oryzias melastigma TaxID=30732 RepID=A0A3B3CHQ8_ORYME